MVAGAESRPKLLAPVRVQVKTFTTSYAKICTGPLSVWCSIFMRNVIHGQPSTVRLKISVGKTSKTTKVHQNSCENYQITTVLAFLAVFDTPIFKPAAQLRSRCFRNRLHRCKRGRRLQNQPLQNRSQLCHGRPPFSHQLHSGAFQPRFVQPKCSILHWWMGLWPMRKPS